MIASFRQIAALALGAWLCMASLAPAADRTADEILADYRAVAVPQRDPARKDAQTIREYRQALMRADARKSELALELFRAHPDHEEVFELLHARWVTTMMDQATAAATVVEIDQALPHIKDEKKAREASFMKVIAIIQANRTRPEVAMPAVDEFIRRDPRDQRAPVLLNGFASGVEDVALRTRLLKRLIEEYPEHPSSKLARNTLDMLQSVGKPLNLEFVDAIKGTTVSIQALKGKVVVLDFWATWCGPCVAEMPRMKTLYAEFKAQGVEFIGVSLDVPKEEGGLEKLKDFVAKNEIPWPQYYQGSGWESEFSTRLGIVSIPQLFLIDAEGNLASIDARSQLETLIPFYLDKAKGLPAAR